MSQASGSFRNGPFSWLGHLSKPERRTMAAAFGGWALDAMDVQMFSLVIPALISVWGLTRGEAGAIGTAALVISAVGGWLGGFLADRFGRVRVLQASILWFAGFTLLSGLSQNVEQLFASRALMGLGFGGEWAAGAVLLGETMQPAYRGRALGLMQAGWAIGWGAAAISYAVLFSVLPTDLAWRALFFVGVAPAVFVFFLRRLVPESAVYLQAKDSGERGAFSEIFQPPLRRVTILGALVGTGAQGGYNAITTWLPTFLRTERGLSVLDSSGYLAVLIAGSFTGYLSGGSLSDRLGRRRTFLLFAICAGSIVVIYTAVPFGNGAMLVLGFPLGFFGAGVFSGMGPFFTEQFPTRVRGVGQGFTYNVGRAIGALFPALVGVLSGYFGLGWAIGLFASVAYAIMAVAAFMLPETSGKALEEIPPATL
ncbi:MAG: MFS transporter [Janthinobacterium lividum]